MFIDIHLIHNVFVGDLNSIQKMYIINKRVCLVIVCILHNVYCMTLIYPTWYWFFVSVFTLHFTCNHCWIQVLVRLLNQTLHVSQMVWYIDVYYAIKCCSCICQPAFLIHNNTWKLCNRPFVNFIDNKCIPVIFVLIELAHQVLISMKQ